MVEIELDGQKVEVAEGSMVMHAAEKAKIYIPHFCYHKKLSIAANCRMCLVDVEKAPKPMPACATPVTQGMIVRTKSDKAIKAQKSVMEFLLINHPLDCPICDQGGECQLQDLAVGYGGGSSRYQEEKRVVAPKDVGPLISMEEMSRCIHCTRCVRFGQEIAGVMELGMSHRGEHSEIETFVGHTVDSELSGNMIDICPVGALTSKPFRYKARTWELSRRKSVSPHDSTGANLIVQVKNDRVLRVVPLENEAVNECWIADRDRYSYEALNGADRLTRPMLKQGGQWQEVDWQTALEYVANGLKQIKDQHGAAAIGALVSPHSTLEELHLATALVRGLGSDNIDHRLRHAEFPRYEGVRWLGLPIAALSQLQRVLVVGSDVNSRILDWRDRTTCVLFGDGAGAVVLQVTEEPGGLLSFVLGSDGSGAELLWVPAGGSRTPASRDTVEQRQHYIKMDGPAVFRFATTIMPEALLTALDRAGMSPQDVDLLIPHQANIRIINGARRRLDIREDAVFTNVDRYGNTSAASIPVALCEAIAEGRVHRGSNVAMVAFGAGLTWGAAVWKWNT